MHTCHPKNQGYPHSEYEYVPVGDLLLLANFSNICKCWKGEIWLKEKSDSNMLLCDANLTFGAHLFPEEDTGLGEQLGALPQRLNHCCKKGHTELRCLFICVVHRVYFHNTWRWGVTRLWFRRTPQWGACTEDFWGSIKSQTDLDWIYFCCYKPLLSLAQLAATH